MANTIMRIQEEIEMWKLKAANSEELQECKKLLEIKSRENLDWKRQFDKMNAMHDIERAEADANAGGADAIAELKKKLMKSEFSLGEVTDE